MDSSEAHEGIINSALVAVYINDQQQPVGVSESNSVTVKVEQAEIEKYVDKAVHQDVKIDEESTYDIVAYVTTTPQFTDITKGNRGFFQIQGNVTEL